MVECSVIRFDFEFRCESDGKSFEVVESFEVS